MTLDEVLKNLETLIHDRSRRRCQGSYESADYYNGYKAGEESVVYEIEDLVEEIKKT